MKNKTTLILLGFLILAILFGVNTKYNEHKLQTKLVEVTSENIILKEKTVVVNNLPTIDSLLIKGNYELALNEYEEQFELITDNYKEVVKFRIDIANQFINLSEQKPKKIKSNVNSFTKRDTSVEKEDNNQPINNKVVSRGLTSKKETTENESSKNAYLTFKSSKKNELHYVGEIYKGKANGVGTAIFDTGGRYEGEWKNNSREGKGIFYWTDGQYYQGEYENDLRHGTGTYFWPNGEKYIGEWKKDKRHGEGTFYYKNGKVVKGTWRKDNLVDEIK